MGVEAGDKRFFGSGSRASHTNVEQVRIEEIDALRFAASLSVMLFHYAMEYRDLEWLRPVARFGFLGVELFFMISGFVIAYTAFMNAYDIRTDFAFVVACAMDGTSKDRCRNGAFIECRHRVCVCHRNEILPQAQSDPVGLATDDFTQVNL